MEEHSLAGLMTVLFADLGASVIVALPELAILHLLDLKGKDYCTMRFLSGFLYYHNL